MTLSTVPMDTFALLAISFTPELGWSFFIEIFVYVHEIYSKFIETTNHAFATDLFGGLFPVCLYIQTGYPIQTRLCQNLPRFAEQALPGCTFRTAPRPYDQFQQGLPQLPDCHRQCVFRIQDGPCRLTSRTGQVCRRSNRAFCARGSYQPRSDRC